VLTREVAPRTALDANLSVRDEDERSHTVPLELVGPAAVVARELLGRGGQHGRELRSGRRTYDCSTTRRRSVISSTAWAGPSLVFAATSSPMRTGRTSAMRPIFSQLDRDVPGDARRSRPGDARRSAVGRLACLTHACGHAQTPVGGAGDGEPRVVGEGGLDPLDARDVAGRVLREP